MTTYKGHYTVHATEHPDLSEVLAGEPSARRRARLLVTLAEKGCMLQKMGLTGTNSTMPASPPASDVAHTDNADAKHVSAALGGEFFTNVLAEFMSPVCDVPAEETGDDHDCPKAR